MNREQRLAQWLDGKLDSNGCEELLRELRADDAFASEAVEQLQMGRILSAHALDEREFVREVMFRINSDADAVPPLEQAVLARLQLRRRWHRAGLGLLGLATALAVALLVFLRPGPAIVPNVRVLAAEGVQSLDVRALEAGRLVTIDSGILELELGEKSRLVLEAPANFALESDSVVRLYSGRCYAEMEKGTSGLRIKTPAGEVLDLGTRFGVEVMASGDTSVHVFEGEVEIAHEQKRSVLREGEGVKWTHGDDLMVVAAEAERFVSQLPRKEQRPAKWLHWSFDEGSGEVAVPQGEGFPEAMDAAQLHGARWIERKGSGALEFDGIDDWVQTNFSGIGSNADRTVAAWVRLAPDFGFDHGRAIVGWGNYNPFGSPQPPRICRAWELSVGFGRKESGRLGQLRLAVGGPVTVGHKDLRDGQWHHVAAVYFGRGAPNGRGIVLLYVDGQLQHRAFGKNVVKVNTDVESLAAEDVQFGRQVVLPTKNRKHFYGAIDEVFIINQALSGAEIRSLMESNVVQ